MPGDGGLPSLERSPDEQTHEEAVATNAERLGITPIEAFESYHKPDCQVMTHATGALVPAGCHIRTTAKSRWRRCTCGLDDLLAEERQRVLDVVETELRRLVGLAGQWGDGPGSVGQLVDLTNVYGSFEVLRHALGAPSAVDEPEGW